MFQKILPHLLAVALFVALAAAFNAPVLSGKRIAQNDIKQHRGSAAEVIDFREQENRQILWTNRMFSGMPTYLISVINSGELMRYIPKAVNTLLINPAIGYPFLLMLGFYVLGLSLRLPPTIAAIGALAYAFSSYFMIILEAGHNSKIHAMAYLPGILAGMIWAYRRQNIAVGLALFSLFTALELSARHPQMFYYFLFLAIPYAIWEAFVAFRQKRLGGWLKASAFLLLGAVLALGSSLPYLQSTYQYGKHSIRGKSELSLDQGNKTDGLDRDYATAWSYGQAESFSLLVPNYKGGATGAIGSNEQAMAAVDARFRQTIAQQNQYFGDQPFTSGPVYAGAVVVLLALLALFLLPGGFKYLLLAVLAFTLALAWGKNFPGLTNWALDNLPFYNKFRAVSSLMVIPEFILPLLAALALGRFASWQKADWQKAQRLPLLGARPRAQLVLGGAALLLAFLLVSYLAPATFNSFLSSQESEQLPAMLSNAGLNAVQAQSFMDSLIGARQALFKADVLRSFWLVLVATALLWAWQRAWLKPQYALLGLGLLVLGDLWTVNKRYLNEDNFVPQSQLERSYGEEPSAADRFIQARYAQEPYFRTANLAVSTFNDATTSFFHYSIGGYHGAKSKIYQELIEQQLGGELEALRGALQNGRFQPDFFRQTPALNMLNTCFFIVDPSGKPLENPYRLGNAWLVKELSVVADANAEIKALRDFDPAQKAILRQAQAEGLAPLPAGAGEGEVELTHYDPEELRYRYRSATANLVVFSEIWYPENWEVYIDGEAASLLRANYVLRALAVPAGEHEIRMVYRDKSLAQANNFAWLSSLLILLGAPLLLYWGGTKSAQRESEA